MNWHRCVLLLSIVASRATASYHFAPENQHSIHPFEQACHIRAAQRYHEISRQEYCARYFSEIIQKNTRVQNQDTHSDTESQHNPRVDWQALRSRREAIRSTFDTQRDELAHDMAEWREFLDKKQGDSSHLERRIHAVHTINHGQVVYTEQSYVLSSSATALIKHNGSNSAHYTTHYGNQLQQAIHQECIDGIERLAIIQPSTTIYPYQYEIATCFEAAREYNQEGLTSKAAAIVDFCWTLLDCGVAIAQGAVDGVIGAVKDIATHPLEAAVCAMAGNYVLAYQLSKVLCNLADIGITALVDRDQAAQKWDDYIAPITDLIETLNDKQITLHDALRGATHIAVQWKTQEKLLRGLSSICAIAKTQALEFAKNNPLKTPQEYMATPDGIVLQSIRSNQDVKISKTNTATKKLKQANTTQINQTCEAVLKDGYYEVNGFKFTEYYYKRLWSKGRPAPSLLASEILKESKRIVPDQRPGFMRYETDNWEMVFNPVTKEVYHLQQLN